MASKTEKVCVYVLHIKPFFPPLDIQYYTSPIYSQCTCPFFNPVEITSYIMSPQSYEADLNSFIEQSSGRCGRCKQTLSGHQKVQKIPYLLRADGYTPPSRTHCITASRYSMRRWTHRGAMAVVASSFLFSCAFLQAFTQDLSEAYTKMTLLGERYETRNAL